VKKKKKSFFFLSFLSFLMTRGAQRKGPAYEQYMVFERKKKTKKEKKIKKQAKQLTLARARSEDFGTGPRGRNGPRVVGRQKPADIAHPPALDHAVLIVGPPKKRTVCMCVCVYVYYYYFFYVCCC
jgi:hypothetical protein